VSLLWISDGGKILLVLLLACGNGNTKAEKPENRVKGHGLAPYPASGDDLA